MQVPTFRADPLTPSCDSWCEFPVSDRPNAVRQFFDAAQKDSSMLQVMTAASHVRSQCQVSKKYLCVTEILCLALSLLERPCAGDAKDSLLCMKNMGIQFGT